MQRIIRDTMQKALQDNLSAKAFMSLLQESLVATITYKRGVNVQLENDLYNKLRSDKSAASAIESLYQQELSKKGQNKYRN